MISKTVYNGSNYTISSHTQWQDPIRMGIFFYSHSYRYRRLSLVFTIKSAIHLTLFFPYRFLVSTFFLHRQTPRKNSVTQKMSTLIVPATIPPVSEDCEQLRKAFEGLPLLTFSTSFARVCVFFLTIQTLFFMIQIVWESKFTFFAPSLDFLKDRNPDPLFFSKKEKKKVDLKAGVVCDQNGVLDLFTYSLFYT